jgi:hypothetical protein
MVVLGLGGLGPVNPGAHDGQVVSRVRGGEIKSGARAGRSGVVAAVERWTSSRRRIPIGTAPTRF